MSIRNSIEYIINKNIEIDADVDIEDKKRAYYENFLLLLEKSFNVSSAAIVYKEDETNSQYITIDNSNIVVNSKSEVINIDGLFEDHLVDKAVERGTTIYISDTKGEPSSNSDGNSQYLAAISAMYKGKAVAVLAIKRMPFMSFNREILTSVTILLEYFTVEIRKKEVLSNYKELDVIKDDSFKFEYHRLKNLYKNYNVNSIVLVLRINNELQAMRVYEKIEVMLRSLDLVTIVKENNFYYIVLLFPLHDKAAALGYLNRLLNFLDEEKDREFNYMTFNLSQTELLNKYLIEDYSE
jgi:hypothetical protein